MVLSTGRDGSAGGRDPRRIEVYLFDAGEVRQRFNANYAARVGAGLAVKDNFGS